MTALAEVLAAAERVLRDVNHNVRIGDSIALATFVRDLLTREPFTDSRDLEAVGRLTWVSLGGIYRPEQLRSLAADILRAAESAEARDADGKAAP